MEFLADTINSRYVLFVVAVFKIVNNFDGCA